MNKYHGITAENLFAVVPEVIKNDSSMSALAAAIAAVLSSRVNEISELSIYSRIDELPEELLDILAYDFKVDWWSSDYSLEEKRRTLKNAWYVHRHKGTKSAVITAISAIYPNTELQEWWEYDGEPYHFRLIISDPSISAEKHAFVLERVNLYKNLRSVIDNIEYEGSTEPKIYTKVMQFGSETVDYATATIQI